MSSIAIPHFGARIARVAAPRRRSTFIAPARERALFVASSIAGGTTVALAAVGLALVA